MDGLEKIIQKIESDAEKAVASIIADAEKRAKDIIDEAESSGDSEAGDIIEAAKAECNGMIRKAHSGGELSKRQTVLSCRVEVIDSVMEKAVRNFLSENPEKYFDSMITLAKKYVFAGEQEMIFSDRDIARMPADFQKNLSKAVGSGSTVTVRGGGSFEGGFLLVGEDIVENCTLESLIGDKEIEIRDELCALLFI